MIASRAYVVCIFGGLIWWATRSITAALACMAATAVAIGIASVLGHEDDTDGECQRMDNEGGRINEGDE